MIVVTGASGGIGRQVLNRLLETVPASELTASVRNPGSVQELADRGVRVVQADFGDAPSLRSAFDGASRLLLVSSNTRDVDPVTQHATAVDAARAVGVGRVFYTSHMGAGIDSPFPPARTHAATEELLARSGVAWTSLRHGFYAVTPTFVLGDAMRTRRLVTPADGPVSWTDRGDLAEADAALLLAEHVADGPTAPLTASAAVDFDGVAAMLSELAGGAVEHAVVDDEEWVRETVAQSQPEPAARFTLTIFQAAREGRFATVDPELGRLLGHAPRALREVLGAAIG